MAVSGVEHPVLAEGPGNLPAVWDQTSKTVRLDCSPLPNPNLLPLAGPNPYPYLSTCRFCQNVAQSVSSNLQYCYSGFSIHGCIQIIYNELQNYAFGIVLSFADSLATCMIKKSEGSSLPHPENERQWSDNAFLFCILGNPIDNLLQTFINEV